MTTLIGGNSFKELEVLDSNMTRRLRAHFKNESYYAMAASVLISRSATEALEKYCKTQNLTGGRTTNLFYVTLNRMRNAGLLVKSTPQCRIPFAFLREEIRQIALPSVERVISQQGNGIGCTAILIVHGDEVNVKIFSADGEVAPCNNCQKPGMYQNVLLPPREELSGKIVSDNELYTDTKAVLQRTLLHGTSVCNELDCQKAFFAKQLEGARARKITIAKIA